VLNILFLVGVTGWTRFQQIKYICNNNSSLNNNNKILEADDVTKLLRLNKYSLYAVIMIVFLISTVAAFRSSENLPLHLLGALPVFGASGIFLLLQSKISYLLIPLNVNSLRIARIRSMCTITAVVFGTLMILMILWSSIDLKVPIEKVWGVERLLWDQSYGGYVQHCLSAVFEWIIICIFCPFFATYIPEFKRISIHNGEINYKFIQTTNSVNI